VTIREPGFFDFYVIGEHLRRFFEANYSHGGPIYFYVPVIAAGMLPWTLIMLLLPWRSLEPDSARRFCVTAVVVVFVLFSLARAKLVPYVLPVFPPAAVIAADAIIAFSDSKLDPRRFALLGPAFGLAGAAVIAVAINAHRFRSANPLIVHPALYLAGAIVLIAAAVSFVAFWGRSTRAGLTTIIVAAAAVMLTIGYGRVLAEPTRSYAALAREIEQHAPDAVLICYPRYVQSLPFYCRRRVILVGDPTELSYGAEHSVDGGRYFFKTKSDVIRLWRELKNPVLVVDRNALPPIEKSLGDYQVIASDSHKFAIAPANREGRENKPNG
jgi:4-amino-4-deoxy-L-arabinose transferase-like glycosyltransferase